MSDLEIILSILGGFLYISGWGATYAIVTGSKGFKNRTYLDFLYWFMCWWMLAFTLSISIITRLFLNNLIFFMDFLSGDTGE